jgi:hypothetical protein
MSSIEAEALGLRVISLADRMRVVVWELMERQFPHNDHLAEVLGQLREAFGVGVILPPDPSSDRLRYQYLLDIERLYSDALSKAEALLTE